jgi:hypothetical protein
MKKNPAASADRADRAQLEFKETVLCRGSGIAEVVERAVSKKSRYRAAEEDGQPVKFEMTEQTREAIDNYLAAAGKKPGEFIFGGRRGRDRPITTRQYARLVGQWIAGIGRTQGSLGRTHCAEPKRPSFTAGLATCGQFSFWWDTRK